MARASAFFVMGLPEVWRRDADHARDPNLERFLLGVMIHEIVHTRHLPAIVEQAKALAARYRLGSLQLDDDVIQKRFEGTPGFKKAFEAERDMFSEPWANPMQVGAMRWWRGLFQWRVSVGRATFAVMTKCTGSLKICS